MWVQYGVRFSLFGKDGMKREQCIHGIRSAKLQPTLSSQTQTSTYTYKSMLYTHIHTLILFGGVGGKYKQLKYMHGACLLYTLHGPIHTYTTLQILRILTGTRLNIMWFMFVCLGNYFYSHSNEHTHTRTLYI